MTSLTWRCVGWRTASSAQRAPLRGLDEHAGAGICLHTCARDAWLVPGPADGLDRALARLGLAGAVERADGDAALRALLRVVVGLDAAVEGEADVGRQVRAALADAPLPDARRVNHVLARLLREGRRAGWVRESHGVARLAVEAVRARGVTGAVGVIGAGAMGARVATLLADRAVRFNRTPGPGVRALDAIAPLDAWIVATSAREPWFLPPEPFTAVVDLGHPAQLLAGPADPRHMLLDALLAGADARLPPAVPAEAESAVDRAAAELARWLTDGERAAATRGGVAGGRAPPPQDDEAPEPSRASA
jgi:hypothetical protein